MTPPIEQSLDLTDRWKRVIRYLRVSVTDHCNYRCHYCMPEEGWARSPRSELLTLEELYDVIESFTFLGVERIRFTGGEPLLRRNLIQLIERVNQLSDIKEIALTTNGHLLERYAQQLYDAGLRRLNISVDTFDPVEFTKITRGGDLFKILDGIERAQNIGFTNIQINAVLSDCIPQSPTHWKSFCENAWRRGLTPRFIEMMPIGPTEVRQTLPTCQQVRTTLHALFTMDYPNVEDLIRGPAQYMHVKEGSFSGARVGFISPLSDSGFCGTCNRARLSAKGALRACLADDNEVDLKMPLRSGFNGLALAPFIRNAIHGKAEHHMMNLQKTPQQGMSAIGG